MNIYALNKIFVEGESDKRFIDFLLNTFYEIIDADLVIDVKGKDKLKDNPLLIDERRKSEGAKNLIIFDTDFDNSTSKGGREKRLEEYKKIGKDLSVDFRIFLLPFNDESDGILENLINTCFKKEFDFFDGCWSGMIDCIKTEKIENLNVPAQKAFVFSKIDLFRDNRILEKWDYKSSSKYEYLDSGIWNFDRENNKKLNKLLEFIENNLFENE